MSDRTLILDSKQIEQKINRIAHQLLENYYDLNELVIVGIADSGYKLAERIYKVLNPIFDGELNLEKITIDKNDSHQNVVGFTSNNKELTGKSIVLVDDVLNSGRTLIHATKYLLNSDLNSLTTVVLVDRRHRKFPIRADHVGLTLSTTVLEHINVDLNENKVYLE